MAHDDRSKDNTDRAYKPKDQGRTDRAPRGQVSTPVVFQFGPGPKTVQPLSRESLQKAEPEKQRPRNFSRENQLGAVMRGERESQNVLRDQFRDAQSRDENNPAEKPRSTRSPDRER